LRVKMSITLSLECSSTNLGINISPCGSSHINT